MDFYKRVGITVRTVPEGRVATYGQIALLCGKPKNARQVGYALNRGLAGEVPAHRVVNSQGYLTAQRPLNIRTCRECFWRRKRSWYRRRDAWT